MYLAGLGVNLKSICHCKKYSPHHFVVSRFVVHQHYRLRIDFRHYINLKYQWASFLFPSRSPYLLQLFLGQIHVLPAKFHHKSPREDRYIFTPNPFCFMFLRLVGFATSVKRLTFSWIDSICFYGTSESETVEITMEGAHITR